MSAVFWIGLTILVCAQLFTPRFREKDEQFRQRCLAWFRLKPAGLKVLSVLLLIGAAALVIVIFCLLGYGLTRL